MRAETVESLRQHVDHAREKHPEWVRNVDYVVDVAEMEWQEVRHALRWEGRERAKEEAYDLMAVLVRFIEDDADKGKTWPTSSCVKSASMCIAASRSKP